MTAAAAPNVVAAAAADLAAALTGVDGVRLYPLGESLDPPAVVVGPPALTWEAYCEDPTSARFVVALAVPASDRAFDALLELLPQVVAAINGLDSAVVVSANPDLYPAGRTDLPAYLIETEVAL